MTLYTILGILLGLLISNWIIVSILEKKNK